MADISSILNKVNKKLEKKGISAQINLGTDRVVDFLSTGIPMVDLITGGGIPLGRTIHLFGVPSGGKSWMCQKIISSAQKRGLTCAYLDCEKSFDRKWATQLGVDVDKLAYAEVSDAEITLQVMRELVESKGVDLVVLDSIAALVPKDELDKNFDEEAKIAGTARLMSKAMRVLNAKGAGKVTMLFINQIRDNVGSYGGGSTTPGGKAVKFYASQELNISRGKDIKRGDKVIGYEMRVLIEKNKVGTPKGRAIINMFQDGSFDKQEMLVDMCLLNNIFGQFKKDGNSYFLGDAKIAGKRDDFVTYLKANDEEYKALEKVVLANLLSLKFEQEDIPDAVDTDVVPAEVEE